MNIANKGNDYNEIEQPLVSVIITSYNYAAYLKQAIDSVLAQTYSKFEIIVVDDGSQDESRNIISSYGKRLIPIFKENGGQASGFNAGIAMSQGELICFLDADDLWIPSKLEATVQAALAYPGAALIYHRMQWINAQGIPYGKPWPFTLFQGHIAHKLTRAGGWWRYSPTTGLSIRKSFFEKVPSIPESTYRLIPDAYLTGLAPYLGEVVGIPEVLGCYRIHGANQWGNPNQIHNISRARNEAVLYEKHTAYLNQILNDLGIDQHISLEDNWHYQYHKWRLGEGYGPFQLSWRMLQAPTVHPLSRIKNLTRIWKQTLGLKKPRAILKELLEKP
jgi:glycosyltransferase involved in cell wall biosynthesis